MGQNQADIDRKYSLWQLKVMCVTLELFQQSHSCHAQATIHLTMLKTEEILTWLRAAWWMCECSPDKLL